MAAINRTMGALVLYGAFTAALLLSQPAQAAPEPVQTEIGAIIQGRLEESDSRLSAGQYADAYTFVGTAGEEILLNLASSDFDGFLSLLNSDGDLVAIDDDTGDGVGALISKFTLPETDTYTVQVSSYHADETGEYTLSLNETPVMHPAEQLALGERIRGELTDDDEQFDTGQRFDAYSFAAQAGQAVALTVRSKAFDSYLWLLNEDERIITVNDDAESAAVPGKGFYVMPGRDGHPGPVLFLGRDLGQTSQIVFFPPVTGTYTVLAGSRDAGGEGKYSLDIATVAVPENVRSGSIADGASGELNSSDYQLSTGQYVDVYTFSGEQGQSISILLNSSSFKGLLRIFDSEGNLVREATSIENFILPATGTYYLWVSSIFNGSTGEYSLSFSKDENGALQESAASAAGSDTEEGVQLFIQETGTGGGRAAQGNAALSEMAFGEKYEGKGGVDPYISLGGSYTAYVKVTVHKSRVPLPVTVTLTEGSKKITIGGSPKNDTIKSANCPSSGDYCTKVFPTSFTLTASAAATAGKYTIEATAPNVGNGTDVDYLYVIKTEMDSVDANFAPSVENLNVRYTIKPTEYTASFGKIEVFKNGDAVNPIFKDEAITKTGTNVLYEWDGKANQGADSGKYVGPKDSPYTVKVSISEKADFSSKCSDSDTKTTKVEVESITLTPAGAENVVKPNTAATEIDKDIEALVKVKKKDGTGAPTEIAIKVDWSFEDPDDTATRAGIDSNGGSGDDNAPIANGGKRGAASVMWKAVAGFTTTVNKNLADSETKTAGADKGKTKIQFSSSAIAADNYILVAQCKNTAGAVLKEKKSGTWSVRKTVTFPNVYTMNGGVDAGAMMAVANINPAFNVDGYTDYSLGAVTALPAGNKSPEYVVPLLAPNAGETPSGQELATYLASSTPDVDVAPLGDFPGPGDTDHDGDGNLDTSADVDVAPLGDFPGPGDTDHNGDGNLDSVATAADKNAAKAAITAKAQAWFTRNNNNHGPALNTYVTLIGAAGRSIIGARYQASKLDGRAATGQTAYYPAGISVNTPGGPADPDSDWYEPQGTTLGDIVFIWQNAGGAARRQVVGRHEVGHASDHVSFGPGDHAASGLMHYTGDQSAANPNGVSTFADDSILRLRGWSP